MGCLGRVVRAGEALVGAGLAAGALGAWALAPRSEVWRKLQGASGVPGRYFAHRGLHDFGSGIERDLSQAGQDERDYVALARQLALGSNNNGRHGTSSEAVTQDWSATKANSAFSSLSPENSLPSFGAAAQIGYGIELDVHLTKDGQVVVIHDDDFKRMADDGRKVAEMTYEELSRIALGPLADADAHASQSNPAKSELEQTAGGPQTAESAPSHGRHARHSTEPEPIHAPLLTDVLKLVDGRVPLIVEYKMGSRLDRELMEKTDAILAAYTGQYVIESFNPLALAWYRYHRPGVCRGQLAAPYHGKPRTGAEIVQALAGSLMLNWLGRPDFVAYEWHGGASLPMRAFRALGGISVAWTLRSREAEVKASDQFDYFIFESYLPPVAY
ncbi:glycerophosphodiester phosphodiesterase [Bombiscardovia apis]|uniref:Glycerophosphodiester phosphodiesterase n=1 Tax=Bombiscardovia apis TaxID=2932182 RepID=A0ABM8BEL8_9BIFI|nr:glycerophosphodiester phosphodiesterase family protein [Bombiscardovia apis]BDR55359.1 glycerophosphodiester phosphodiesterase [Bombiscardovia apis]